MNHTIVFLDAYSLNHDDLSWNGLQALGTLKIYDRTTPELIVDRAKDADILIVNKIKMTATIFSQLPSLNLVCEAATGYDNIDVEAAKKSGIKVANVANYSTYSVAQYVLSHLLHVVSPVASYIHETRLGKWAKSIDFCFWDKPSIELAGKVATVIGYGHIGERVALLLNALGMEVQVVTKRRDIPLYLKKVTIEEAFKTSMVITLCCPLRPENREFVNKNMLCLCKPEMILINTARGGLVNEKDLYTALVQKQLHAYCADVLTHEPPQKDHPLLNLSNVYVTPHIAWTTIEARQRIMDTLIANIRAFDIGDTGHFIV